MKIIYEKDAIDALHRTMLGFFKTNDDDKPEFITASEKMLLSVNKAISKALKALPSAQPEIMYYPQVDGVTASIITQHEIIRCKECMHNGSFDTDCPIDWNGKEYCSFAERRTE